MLFFLSLTYSLVLQGRFWVRWLIVWSCGSVSPYLQDNQRPFICFCPGEVKKLWTYFPVVKKNQKRASFSYFYLHAAPLVYESGVKQKSLWGGGLKTSPSWGKMYRAGTARWEPKESVRTSGEVNSSLCKQAANISRRPQNLDKSLSPPHACFPLSIHF